MKNQANIYEARFSALAIRLRKSESKADTNRILEEYLYGSFKDRVPSKEDFISSFANLKFSKNFIPTNVMTKYALKKISAKMDGNEMFHLDSSVEHIINEDLSNVETLEIGNLICLERSLNEEADNLTFEEKIEVYKKSKYDQIKVFLDNNLEFTNESIKERSKKLGEYYYDNILNFES